MQFEKNRLFTLNNWPPNSRVNPRDLAKCGFFATGRWYEAQCHWCRCKISRWNLGDTVEELHRKTSPNCIFLIGLNCGNIPIPPSPPLRRPNMFKEWDRLCTFQNWPSMDVTAEDLAKAGFFFVRYRGDDRVQCAYCHGILANWQAGDDAFDEHERAFPDCPRAKLGRLISLSDDVDKLRILPYVEPMEPYCASEDIRIMTFANWPKNNKQEPTLLAQAGFYFRDFPDTVQCFYCHLLLDKWKKEDDPFQEHLEFSPQCYFINLVIESRKKIANEADEDELPGTSIQKLREEHRRLKAASKCIICLDQEVNAVFLPCGHLITCIKCGPKAVECPKCLSDVKGLVRIYSC